MPSQSESQLVLSPTVPASLAATLRSNQLGTDATGKTNIPALRHDMLELTHHLDRLTRTHAIDRAAIRDALLKLTMVVDDLRNNATPRPHPLSRSVTLNSVFITSLRDSNERRTPAPAKSASWMYASAPSRTTPARHLAIRDHCQPGARWGHQRIVANPRDLVNGHPASRRPQQLRARSNGQDLVRFLFSSH